MENEYTKQIKKRIYLILTLRIKYKTIYRVHCSVYSNCCKIFYYLYTFFNFEPLPAEFLQETIGLKQIPPACLWDNYSRCRILASDKHAVSKTSWMFRRPLWPASLPPFLNLSLFSGSAISSTTVREFSNTDIFLVQPIFYCLPAKVHKSGRFYTNEFFPFPLCF